MLAGRWASLVGLIPGGTVPQHPGISFLAGRADLRLARTAPAMTLIVVVLRGGLLLFLGMKGLRCSSIRCGLAIAI